MLNKLLNVSQIIKQISRRQGKLARSFNYFVQPLIRNVEYIFSNSWAAPPEVELTVFNCSAASVCVIQPNCSLLTLS